MDKDLGTTLLVVLGIVAALLPWVLPNPSRRTRIIGGSICVVLLLFAVGLSNWEPRSPQTPRLKTIGAAGHEWPESVTAWTRSPVDTIEVGPIAAGNYLVVKTNHRRIQVFNASSGGTSPWPPYVTNDDSAQLTVINDRVVVMDSHGISALSIRDGKRLWSRSSNGFFFLGDSLVVDDLLLVSSGQSLGALSLKSGKTRWTWESGRDDLQQIVAASGAVYAAGAKGHIYSLDVGNGRLRWTHKIANGDPVEDRPESEESLMTAVDRVLVFPAGPRGNVYGIDTETGKELWHRSFSDQVQGIKQGNSQALVVTSGNVVAVDAASGTELWGHAMDRATVAANRLYGVIFDEEAEKVHLTAIDINGGTELWRTSLEEIPYLSLFSSIVSGTLLYFHNEETLYMLDPASGKPRGIYKSHSSLGGAGTEVGNLTVVRDGDRLVALRRG